MGLMREALDPAAVWNPPSSRSPRRAASPTDDRVAERARQPWLPPNHRVRGCMSHLRRVAPRPMEHARGTRALEAPAAPQGQLHRAHDCSAACPDVHDLQRCVASCSARDRAFSYLRHHATLRHERRAPAGQRLRTDLGPGANTLWGTSAGPALRSDRPARSLRADRPARVRAADIESGIRTRCRAARCQGGARLPARRRTESAAAAVPALPGTRGAPTVPP